MSFGFPLGLLALAALPALVAAYFLRRKQPPRTVSALFLWRSPDTRAEAGPKLQRFSRERSLLLESLAVLLFAFFLADARCGESVRRRHSVVVVDGSLSMRAKAGGATAVERARDEVAAVLREEGASVATVVVSGVKPSVLAGPQAEVDRAMAALEDWQPAQPAHDVGLALQLGRELSSSVDQRVVFITDGPLPVSAVVPKGVEVRSVGRRADNVAFLSAQRTDEAGLARVTVRVGNFTSEGKTVPVRFAAAGGPTQVEKVPLKAGESAVLRVGLKTDGAITASLPGDALAEDDTLTLLPSPVQTVTVGLLTGLDATATQALSRFLAVAPGVVLAGPGATPTLTIGPDGTNARLTVSATPPLRTFVGPFFTQKGHPVLDDVQLGGVAWTLGVNPKGHPLVSAGDAVLVSEEDDGTLHLNLDLSRSNLHRTPAWPVLLSNLTRRARLDAPGFPRKHVMLGDDLSVVTEAGATWRIEGPNGEERHVMAVGAVTLPPATSPGRWTLKKDGEVVDALEVLPLDVRESDLRDRGPYEVKAPEDISLASLTGTAPRSFWPLVVALALVLLNFGWTARRRA